jgi:tetraacyldisaccharide 4'-kinase
MIQFRNILLYPFAVIYGLITDFRNVLYDRKILKSTEFDCPVISVGNLAVGGTGKTPHTEYIASLLRKNFKVATLSRGYKRETRDFRIATPQSRVREIGDEPMQIYRKFPDVLVAVDTSRVDGVSTILEDHPEIEVVILDDAFQHRSLTPGFSIMLTDYSRLFYKDQMLPYGNLREYKTNKRRADVILITKSPGRLSPIERRIIVKDIDKSAYQNIYFTSFRYNPPVPVFEDQPPFNEYKGCGIILITGIANPSPLLEYLEKDYKEIIHMSFSDHHKFTEKDLIDISSAYGKLKAETRYLFTTEKDAVRLREFTNIAEPVRSALYYIPVGIYFLNEDQNEFDNLIIDYVRKNHRNNRISKIQRDS